MKKYLLFLCLILCLIFSSCSADTNKQQTENSTISESNTESEIDVDLTDISSTMLYAEISNMMMNPESYIGKTIKMAGLYTMWYDEETYDEHYACYIMDATACCQQGFEFVLADDFVLEENPLLNSDIEVVGTFETYNEGELIYCRLGNAEMIIL